VVTANDEVLRGGAAPVQRVGKTVRRPWTPYTPAIHAFLRHLEAVGFAGAPRVLGVDDQQREVLTYVEGEDAHHARRAALHSDQALAAAGRLIREYHRAVASFTPSPDAVWRVPGTGPIVCHNDLGPVNTVYVNDAPVAFIDWDFAAPGDAEWDLACAAWSFIPLHDDEFCRRYAYPIAPRGPRLRLLLDAYGLDDRAHFLDRVRQRQQAQYDWVAEGARAGDQTYAAALAAGNGQRWLDAIAFLDRSRDEWQPYLD